MLLNKSENKFRKYSNLIFTSDHIFGSIIQNKTFLKEVPDYFLEYWPITQQGIQSCPFK